MMESDEKLERVRMKSAEHGADGHCGIEIGNLTKVELEACEAMLLGQARIMVNWESGRLEVTPRYAALPEPTDDPEMLPFWRRLDPRHYNIQTTLFNKEACEEIDRYFPHFVIQHLCGYGLYAGGLQAKRCAAGELRV